MNDVQKAVVQHMVEALEQATPHLPVHTDWHFEAIAAGKALLEQPAPVQPVACLSETQARAILDLALDLERTGRIVALSEGQERADFVARNRNIQCALEDALRSATTPPAQTAPVQEPLPDAVQWYGGVKSDEELVHPAAQPAVPLTDDTRRLDALAENSWDLRCFDMSDDDIGWRVIEHHMAKPHERTVAEVFRDDPRQAIDAAIEVHHGITATPTQGENT